MRSLGLVAATVTLLAGTTARLSAGEIHDAVASGDVGRVAEILASDPGSAGEPSQEGFSDLPLHIAARTGQLEIARLLLDAGADVDGFDRDESTPLHVATLYGQTDAIRLLLDRGADVNRRDRNGAYALSFAASGGHADAVRMVLDAGADLNFVSPNGITLAHYACSRGLWDLVDVLTARGGDINRGDDEGTAPIHWVAMGRDTTALARMIERGANVSAADSFNMTPLHIAAERGALPMVRALLAAGADVDHPNDSGMTPLHWASMAPDAAVVPVLLAHGADPNAETDRGATPLVLAAREGRRDAVAALLEAGAGCSAVDEWTGRTALHTACVSGFGDIVQLLVDAGADPNQKDAGGMRPLEYATKYGHERAASILAARKARGPQWEGASTRGLAGAEPVPGGEAEIWHLGHSGWAIETAGHVLIFDYFPQRVLPDTPGLCNGHIDPAELAGRNVTVFVSHDHADHYTRSIFDWATEVPGITYVLGFEPVDTVDYEYIGPRETRTLNGMTITTIRSNDSGVGFVIRVDGLVVFHAGDHANRRRDLTGDYLPEIDFIIEQGVRPDVAFMPVSGCGFGDQVAVRLGVERTIDLLKPALFLPMHGDGVRFKEFVEGCEGRFPGVRMVAAANRGDRVHYRVRGGA